MENESRRRFSKTHHLDELLRECEKVDAGFGEFINEVSILDGYYIESRYPLEVREDIFVKDAKEALEAAEKIRNFVLLKVENKN